MIDKLNTTGADVVIFGGDMFSNPQTKAPDSQMSKDLTTILKSIDAPLGKFAVLGDEDRRMTRQRRSFLRFYMTAILKF